MSSLLRALTLALFLLPLAACGGEETPDTDGAANGAAEASEAGAEATGDAADAGAAATEAADEVAAAVCCGGNCDAEPGYCCGDGTCGGNHAELKLMSSL